MSIKLKLLSGVISALFVTSSFAAPIEGESSTVRFEGEITGTTTCLLEADSKNIVVPLGSISQSAFVASEKSQLKPFTIKLTGCDSAESRAEGNVMTGASVSFRGETVNSGTALKTENDTIGIQIAQNGTPLRLDGSEKSNLVEFGEDGAEMVFTANYLSLAGKDVKTGVANAVADFTVVYE